MLVTTVQKNTYCKLTISAQNLNLLLSTIKVSLEVQVLSIDVWQSNFKIFQEFIKDIDQKFPVH